MRSLVGLDAKEGGTMKPWLSQEQNQWSEVKSLTERARQTDANHLVSTTRLWK